MKSGCRSVKKSSSTKFVARQRYPLLYGTVFPYNTWVVIGTFGPKTYQPSLL